MIAVFLCGPTLKWESWVLLNSIKIKIGLLTHTFGFFSLPLFFSEKLGTPLKTKNSHQEANHSKQQAR